MDSYKNVVLKALENLNVTVCVMDQSEDFFDLEHSRNLSEIVEACEATEAPLVCFYENEESRGNMLVMVGEGEESIADHHVNKFMDHITESCI